MEKDIGALWGRKTAKGGDYFTGMIRVGDAVHQIVVFRNGYKKNPNQPDWQIFPKKANPEQPTETEASPF